MYILVQGRKSPKTFDYFRHIYYLICRAFAPRLFVYNHDLLRDATLRRRQFDKVDT